MSQANSDGRWFTPTLQAAPQAHALRTLIDDICETLLANEPPRQRARKEADKIAWRACVEAVVCNCIALGPDVPHINLLLAARAWKPHRYFKPPFGRDTLRGLLEAMDGQYVDLDVSAWKGEASRYRPLEALEGMLEGFTLAEHVRPSAEAETIILTGDDPDDVRRPRKWLPYVDTPDTERYREEMRTICNAFAEADIRFLDDGLGPVPTERRGLRRHFYHLPGYEHLQWQSGGRIYSDWVSNLSRERRRSGSLLIDSVRCREVDYGSLHLRLASAEAGVVLPKHQDPYAISGLEAVHRPALKVLLNAMLTARGTLRHWPKDFLKTFPQFPAKEWPIKRIREAMLQAHPQLEGVLGERARDAVPPAYHLQWVESEMLVEVLLECARRGLTALPLHDAVLVADGRQEEVRDVLRKVASKRGLRIPVIAK